MWSWRHFRFGSPVSASWYARCSISSSARLRSVMSTHVPSITGSRPGSSTIAQLSRVHIGSPPWRRARRSRLTKTRSSRSRPIHFSRSLSPGGTPVPACRGRPPSTRTRTCARSSRCTRGCARRTWTGRSRRDCARRGSGSAARTSGAPPRRARGPSRRESSRRARRARRRGSAGASTARRSVRRGTGRRRSSRVRALVQLLHLREELLGVGELAEHVPEDALVVARPRTSSGSPRARRSAG